MNIFGSLMDIFDEKNKDIYVERKNKDIYVERNKGIYVENESFLHFLFVLRSPCTNFHYVQVRLHLSSPNKKNDFFLCTAFGLH